MPFATSGASQVFAKVFTSLALAAGLSFPVCILAKSAKMVPVMLGQLALGGCSYTLRDYCIAAAIVGGTALLTLGEQDKETGVSNDGNNNGDYFDNTLAGLAFILISLLMDGVTAGLQKRLKQDAATSGKIPTPYDFLLFTNMSMAATALPIAVMSGDWVAGWAFCAANPAVRRMIGTCCVCSVVGQSFIFYIVAHFDPLVCSTVTTSRKILSVVWSIATKGHSLSEQASLGLLVAVLALLLEVQGKASYRYQQGSRPIASKDYL
jgi:UDP-galactose transporter B1